MINCNHSHSTAKDHPDPRQSPHYCDMFGSSYKYFLVRLQESERLFKVRRRHGDDLAECKLSALAFSILSKSVQTQHSVFSLSSLKHNTV